MNFLIDSDMAFITKSIPPLIPIAKLNGRRYCANPSFIVSAMCTASNRQMAVGIRMGWSFRRLF